MNLPPPLAALARLLRRDLAEIKVAVQDQTRAIRDGAEIAQHKRDSENNTVISTAPDKNLIAEVRPNDPKGQATQTSLKWATWLAAWSALAAFVTASVYAGITYKQMTLLRTANEQSKTQWEAEHRPWVGNGEIGFKQPPVFLVYPHNPKEVQGTQISFLIEIPIKNVGIEPAFHVETELMGTMTEQIAAPPNLDKMMDSACRMADSNSKPVGGVLFPNTAETRVEENANIMAPTQLTQIHRVWITICIAYSGTTSGEQLHHTRIWLASWPINGEPVEIRRTNDPAVIYYTLPITRWGVVRTEAD